MKEEIGASRSSARRFQSTRGDRWTGDVSSEQPRRDLVRPARGRRRAAGAGAPAHRHRSRAPVTRKLVLDVVLEVAALAAVGRRSRRRPRSRWCAAACARRCSRIPGTSIRRASRRNCPRSSKRVRSHGLRVTQIKGPAITDVSEPNAEAIIGAAAQAGCTHYSLGGYTYDLEKPLAPQLDAIKAQRRTLRPVEPETQDHAGLRHRARPGIGRRRRCSICSRC